MSSDSLGSWFSLKQAPPAVVPVQKLFADHRAVLLDRENSSLIVKMLQGIHQKASHGCSDGNTLTDLEPILLAISGTKGPKGNA